MAAELVCPTHGPYDASYRTCPYCSGAINRPPAPPPLDEDNLPTDIRYEHPEVAASAGGRGGIHEEDELPTEIPAKRRTGGRVLDIDEEEETYLGRGARLDVTELDQVETGVLGLLWVKEGRRRGKVYIVRDDTEIGRGGDVVLDDPKVSSHHAKFRLENGQFVIWDLASRNGTFVNGERIRAATPLKENDEIKVGETVFVFKVLA